MPKVQHKIRVGITMGDPSGIGPAIIQKAIWNIKSLAEFIVIGDKRVFSQLPVAGCPLPIRKFIDLNNVNRKSFSFGKVRADYGKASIEYLDKAIELIKKEEIDSLVTCPVSKEAVALSGLRDFKGHTEYLASQTNAKNYAMMLLNRKLKFVLATRHIPLKGAPVQLNERKIYETILLAIASLKKLFLIKDPRIVVCGLNPHASDNGLIGNEENDIIKPAIRRVRKIGRVEGPLPADTAVLKAARKEYDCVVAMYHDQALIPLKILNGHYGVNMTLGFKFIRTSPLHGTAFDIARNYNLIDPASLIEAVKLCVKCSLNQRKA